VLEEFIQAEDCVGKARRLPKLDNEDRGKYDLPGVVARIYSLLKTRDDGLANLNQLCGRYIYLACAGTSGF
jgi:hypothetical protein